MGNEQDEPYVFTEEKREIVIEAQLQIERGEFFTDEQTDKEINKWLSE